MKKRFRFVALVCALSLVAAACGGDDEDAASDDGDSTEAGDAAPAGGDGEPSDLCSIDPVEIIHLTDLVGESATATDSFWNGSTLAADQINEDCGTDVIELERIATDFSVEAIESSLLEAIEAEPDAIIGQGSSSQLIANSTADEAEIPILWPVGNSSGLADGEFGTDWGFMLRPINDLGGAVIGEHLLSIGASDVWLECVETQFGLSGCDAIEEALGEADSEVVGREPAAADASDFSQEIIDLTSAGADALALLLFPGPHIAIMQQLEEQGALEGLTVMGGSTTELIFSTLSDAQRDVTIATADCNPLEDDPEVNAAYAEATGEPLMTGLSAVAYDAVYIIADAAAREGETSPEAIRDGIESTTWSGVCQDYSDSGTHALGHRIVVTSFPDEQTIAIEAEYPLDADGTGLAG